MSGTVAPTGGGWDATGEFPFGSNVSCNVDHGSGRCSWDQPIFDRAAEEANDSPVALFGMALYKTSWLPDTVRKWGSRAWNRYYRRALPRHLRGTR